MITITTQDTKHAWTGVFIGWTIKALRTLTGLNMSRGNKKLDKSILIWSLPAVLTCPNCSQCAAKCYARKAERAYPQVLPARKRNLYATRQAWFVPAMVAYIKRSSSRVVRIHESGDFYSQAYADKWSAIIAACPEKQFYAYTKSPYRPAPAANLNIVESILPTGQVNFGKPCDIDAIHSETGFPICPATVPGNNVTCGCSCTLCQITPNVLFYAH